MEKNLPAMQETQVRSLGQEDPLEKGIAKRLPAMQENWVRSLGWEDPLEQEMVTHSNILVTRSA